MKLKKATKKEYQLHRNISKRRYPEGIAKMLNISLDKARLFAEEQMKSLLPQGYSTPGHHFFTLYDQNTRRGYLWLMEKDDYLFICDIYVLAKYRSQGYGTKVLDWVKTRAKKLKYKTVMLHVFAHNSAALALYKKNGFQTTNLHMRFDIA